MLLILQTMFGIFGFVENISHNFVDTQGIVVFNMKAISLVINREIPSQKDKCWRKKGDTLSFNYNIHNTNSGDDRYNFLERLQTLQQNIDAIKLRKMHIFFSNCSFSNVACIVRLTQGLNGTDNRPKWYP